MTRERGRKERRNSVPHVALLFTDVTVEYKAIIERLKSGRFAHRDRSIVPIVREPPRAGITEVGCYRETDALRVESCVCLAEVIVRKSLSVWELRVPLPGLDVCNLFEELG